MTAKIDGTNGVLQQYDYQTPASGFSYTFAAGTQMLFMVPAATLATGTITMPASPADGMVITFSSSQQITALTLQGNTGQSISSAPTILPAKTAASYVYRLANTTWYPCQTVPAAPVGVGYSQSWQDVTSSRLIGTTYTNSTSSPIQVSITIYTSSANGNVAANFYVNSLKISNMELSGSTGTRTHNVYAVIPAGATYQMTGGYSTGGSLTVLWAELR